MKCPHCDQRIPMPWQRLREKRKLAGLCVDCGTDAKGFYRCHRCRQHVKELRATHHTSTSTSA